MSSNPEWMLQVAWSYDTRCFHINCIVYTANWSLNELAVQPGQ